MLITLEIETLQNNQTQNLLASLNTQKRNIDHFFKTTEDLEKEAQTQIGHQFLETINSTQNIFFHWYTQRRQSLKEEETLEKNLIEKANENLESPYQIEQDAKERQNVKKALRLSQRLPENVDPDQLIEDLFHWDIYYKNHPHEIKGNLISREFQIETLNRYEEQEKARAFDALGKTKMENQLKELKKRESIRKQHKARENKKKIKQKVKTLKPKKTPIMRA